MRAALCFFLAIILLAAAAPVHAGANRIISLAPSITEVLFALGVGSRVIGVSTYCDYPPEAAQVEKVGTFLAPNIERIIAKKPDLIIAVPSPANRNAVESVRDLGLQVLVVDPESVTSIFEAVATIAAAVGVPEAGTALRDRVQARLAAVRARLEGVATRSVLMAVDHRPLIVAGSGTYQDELITLAGGSNLGRQAGSHWPQVGIEFVVAQGPEVIVDTTMGTDEAVKPTDFWNLFTTIPAVREKRIYGARAFILLRPGPRVAESVETMARFIHPERFEGGR
jgi:iron complex transport system substrate-binding protein